MKVFKKIIKRKKQRMLSFMYKQGFLFEKFKEPDKFKEMCKENAVSKTHKTVRNSKFNSKLKMAMNVNTFIDVETCYNYFNVWIRSVWKLLQKNSWKINRKSFYIKSFEADFCEIL